MLPGQSSYTAGTHKQQHSTSTGRVAVKACRPSHHVPGEGGHPVEQRLHSTNELHVFGFTDSFLDEEDHEASRDERHGKDHADGHQHIHRGRYPGDK